MKTLCTLIMIGLYALYTIYLIINIYLPYESPHNIDLFENRLVKLFLYCECLNTSNIYIIVDFNANINIYFKHN